MFPKADCYQLYLQHFAAANALEIKYGSDIPHGAIRREGEGGRYRLTDSDGAVFSCKYLIVATGLGQEVKLPAQMHGSEHVKYYSEFDTDPTRYRNKTVLIMGNGNSALETSEGMVGYTATTFVIGQNSERYSWESHNRGHMRAINRNTLDTYQLKSLNVCQALVPATCPAEVPHSVGFVTLSLPSCRPGDLPISSPNKH
jgi:thioredoxin reductase